MSILDRHRRDWLGIVGLLVGIVGVVLSVIFYRQSIAERRPRYQIDPSRTVIIDPSRIEKAPIRILRADGSEISDSLISCKVYFWNDGKLSIKPENILEPIRVKIDGNSNRILDARIVNSPRKIVRESLVRDSDNSLILDFSMLEFGDGVAIQLVWEGDPKATLSVTGTIEGPAAIVNATPTTWLIIKKLILVISPMLFIAIIAGGMSALLIYLDRIIRPYANKPVMSAIQSVWKIISWAAVAVAIVVIASVILHDLLASIDMVPPSIR